MTAVFDPLAQTYDAWYQTPLGQVVDRLDGRLLLKTARPRAGERALDAGCGTGRLMAGLASLGLTVMGIDISERMLEVARERVRDLPGVYLQYGDMGALTLPPAQFDLVVTCNALEFTEDPRRTVAQLWRLVRPGGRLVVSVFNAWSPWGLSRRRHAGWQGGIFAHACFFSPPQLVGLLRSADDREPLCWNTTVFIPPTSGRGWIAAADFCEAVGQVVCKPFGAIIIARMDRTCATHCRPAVNLRQGLARGHICRSST